MAEVKAVGLAVNTWDPYQAEIERVVDSDLPRADKIEQLTTIMLIVEKKKGEIFSRLPIDAQKLRTLAQRVSPISSHFGDVLRGYADGLSPSTEEKQQTSEFSFTGLLARPLNLASSLLSGLSQSLWPASTQTVEEFEYNPIAAKVSDEIVSRSPRGVPADFTFDQLMANSRAFEARKHFPTTNNLIKNFAITEDLQREVLEHAKAACPLLPRRVWEFIPKWLAFKREYGTANERALYREMIPEQLVDRFNKRPYSFVGGGDGSTMRNGRRILGGFEKIGQDDEDRELCLKDYQSYPEMCIAAYLSMVVPTHFINAGSRHNCGEKGVEGSYEPKGIYVAMVGARYERPAQMEWRFTLVTAKQNTAENGYGLSADPQNPKTIELRLWAELLGLKEEDTYCLPDYETAKADTSGRFVQTYNGLLDALAFKERMGLSIESFLLEADKRAKAVGKKAYVHIVGLGLGVWRIDPAQSRLLIEVYANLLQSRCFENISDINFSYMDGDQCGGVKDQEFIDSQGYPIKILFSKRDPAAKLTGEDEGKLLVAQYAWDSNSYPGNEYWGGSLSASGDPAAACCSLIPELQNPEINPFLSGSNVSIQPAEPVSSSVED